MTSLVKYSTSPRNAEHSPKVSLEHSIAKMRREVQAIKVCSIFIVNNIAKSLCKTNRTSAMLQRYLLC